MAQVQIDIRTILEKYGDLQKSFQRESDRGCAVLIMCSVEEVARDTLRHRLGPFAKNMLAQLAPRGSWEKMKHSLLLLGVLSQMEFDDLSLLCNARNKFAHHAIKDLTFNHTDIAVFIDRLQLHKLMWGGECDRRSCFALTASTIAGLIAARGFQLEPLMPVANIDFPYHA
jgi:hypothetical protein